LANRVSRNACECAQLRCFLQLWTLLVDWTGHLLGIGGTKHQLIFF